ncbi:MAG: DNA repair protein RecN [Deltaproteobacteria bacterium]|nr:DNA repair protein RecN [Deltaproteobacteria bacterium]
MLTGLQIRDFAIVDVIDVEFTRGMTVLTGETGAGKSILVDAIGLVLGERGGSQVVRRGAKRAEFSAEFDLGDVPAARDWLCDQALDEDDSCLVRRVVAADGRSRAFINGQAVTLQQLKALGELLLDIHGQHFHQSLVRRPVQRELVDFYGGLEDTRKATATAFAYWQGLKEELDRLHEADRDRASRLDLLAFQLGELEALALADGEIEGLLSEREKLRHGGRLAEGIGVAVARLTGDEDASAVQLLAEARRAVEALVDYDPELQDIADLLENASIHIAEAGAGLERYAGSIDMDPGRRDWIEERLDAVHRIARKHRVEPDALPGLTEDLRREHAELGRAEERGQQLVHEAAAARAEFADKAAALSKARLKAAKAFSRAVAEAMAGLGMPGGRFEVALDALPEEQARPWGLDEIEFLVSANPGQPPMPLARVASGGELSRISLAIQVIASDGSAIPTMVFDEVDSGVGGRVAEMVGRRLQELGASRQVLCVTHLPQVASLADRHFRVSKMSDGKATRTGILALGQDERVEEIARMLGGVEITRKTLEHAAEMLAGATRKSA